MKHLYLLIPAGRDVGLSTSAFGLVHSLVKNNQNVAFFKPISQHFSEESAVSEQVYEKLTSYRPTPSIPLEEAQSFLAQNKENDLLEKIVGLVHNLNNVDCVVLEGLAFTPEVVSAKRLNLLIAKALGAEVIYVSAPNGRTPLELAETVEIEISELKAFADVKIAGHLINKIGFQENSYHNSNHDGLLNQTENLSLSDQFEAVFLEHKLPVIASIPYTPKWLEPRIQSVAHHLDSQQIRISSIQAGQTRVQKISMISAPLQESLLDFKPGSLLLIDQDRSDLICAASLFHRHQKATQGLAGLILCSSHHPISDLTLSWTQEEVEPFLNIYQSPYTLFEVAQKLSSFKMEISHEDVDFIVEVCEHMVLYFKSDWMHSSVGQQSQIKLTPLRFRHNLIQTAQSSIQKIVLPEGNEPRTIQAAQMVAQKGIAHPILLADPLEVFHICQQLNISLSPAVQILNPLHIFEKYVPALVQARKHKGMTEELARKELQDTVVLGTLMLHLDEVDGLVSGAVHTTADTVRPALQIIKCLPGVSQVSSVFFMGLPEQVVVYGDCAIVLDPNSEELATIATQSAQTAQAFGIDPKIAMISYSTGSSGQGDDVTKVRMATQIIQEKNPEMVVDGPIQYDAATDPKVAQSKAPNSVLKGRANVFIFPDLNTGNTTYKAVQRSAHVDSIGPVLQGLAKPVNDLSRGATVDDIVFTIAVTAVQAISKKN